MYSREVRKSCFELKPPTLHELFSFGHGLGKLEFERLAPRIRMRDDMVFASEGRTCAPLPRQEWEGRSAIGGLPGIAAFEWPRWISAAGAPPVDKRRREKVIKKTSAEEEK